MAPAAVTPAGSAGAPAEFCDTCISVCALSAPAGMTTFAPLASVTVPPAAPTPGGGGGVVPPPLLGPESPPPPQPALRRSTATAKARAQIPVHFIVVVPAMHLLMLGTTTIPGE